MRYRLDGGADWHALRASGEYTWFSDWQGEDPGPGEHTLEVEAVDGAGERWTKTASFRVGDAPPVAPAGGTAWAQQHGDARHSGATPDAVDPAKLRLAWSHRTPGTFLTGSPVISGQTVYAATRDENGEDRAAVYAIDLATGRRLWEFRTDISVHGPIAVAGGVVYAQSLRSTLYALDAGDGRLLWKRGPGDAPEPNNQRTYGYYGVTVADGQGALDAPGPLRGRQPGRDRGARPGDRRDDLAVADGRLDDERRHARRRRRSRLRRQPDRRPDARVRPRRRPPALDLRGAARQLAGRYAGDRCRTGVHRCRQRARRARRRDGAGAVGPPQRRPVVPASERHAGDPGGRRRRRLHGLPGRARHRAGRRERQRVWTHALPGRPDFGGVHSSPAVSGDTVYVGSNNGSFYALDRATGAIEWEREIGTWVGAGPAISGNAVVFGAWDGNLYTFAEQE